MRRFALFILISFITSAAYAQAAPGSAQDGPTIVNGKIQIGYDGRGDYLRERKLAKEKKASTNATIPVDSTAVAGGNAGTAEPASPEAQYVEPAEPPPQESKQEKPRGDSALKGDRKLLNPQAQPEYRDDPEMHDSEEYTPPE